MSEIVTDGLVSSAALKAVRSRNLSITWKMSSCWETDDVAWRDIRRGLDRALLADVASALNLSVTWN